jgi:hypothetical protein
MYVVSQEPSDAAPHDERGEPEFADRLLALVCEELRELAARKMAREGPNQTLQATALVHEAWLYREIKAAKP